MSDWSGRQPAREKLLPFQGPHDIDGLCHVRVYEPHGRLPVVVVGELDDNPGTKITNGAPLVARAVEREFFLEGREFLLVEHHPASLFDGARHEFELVHELHRSEIEDIEALTGCPVKTWPKGRYTARAVAGLQGECLRRQVAARGRAAAQRLIATLAEQHRGSPRRGVSDPRPAQRPNPFWRPPGLTRRRRGQAAREVPASHRRPGDPAGRGAGTRP